MKKERAEKDMKGRMFAFAFSSTLNVTVGFLSFAVIASDSRVKLRIKLSSGIFNMRS